MSEIVIELVDDEIVDFEYILIEHKKDLIDNNKLEFKKEISKDKLSKDIYTKLNNYIEQKFLTISVNELKKEIIKDIENNGVLWCQFIKDPNRQNCGENIQKFYLHKYNILVRKPEKEIRLYDGEFIIGKQKIKLNATKSVDFEDKMNDKIVYKC
jgi:hypothetical protein